MSTTATPESTEALEVELPVCPRCLRVGKIPTGWFGGKDFCNGGSANSHPRVKMKKAKFRQIEEAK